MTNREEVVERMALAAIEAYGAKHDDASLGRDGKIRSAIENRRIEMRTALSIAEEAVLEELMEATPEMFEASWNTCESQGRGYTPNKQKRGETAKAYKLRKHAQKMMPRWQAMLSASPFYRRVKGE